MLMQAAIIVIVVTPFSFDLHLAHVLVGVVVLAGFSIGVGALSFALALVSKDQDWLFWTVQQTLIFPVLLLAGVLLPLDGAPGWLRVASHAEPAEVRRRGRARAVRGHLPGRHGGSTAPWRPRSSRRSACSSASGRCAPPADPSPDHTADPSGLTGRRALRFAWSVL